VKGSSSVTISAPSAAGGNTVMMIARMM
jgi:hypothetical protein